MSFNCVMRVAFMRSNPYFPLQSYHAERCNAVCDTCHCHSRQSLSHICICTPTLDLLQILHAPSPIWNNRSASAALKVNKEQMHQFPVFLVIFNFSFSSLSLSIFRTNILKTKCYYACAWVVRVENKLLSWVNFFFLNF